MLFSAADGDGERERTREREREREKEGVSLTHSVSLSLTQSLHLSVLCPAVSVLWNSRTMGLDNTFPGRMSWQVATVCVCIRGWKLGRGLQIVSMNLCECLCSGGTGAVWGQCAAKLLTHFLTNTNTQWKRQETMFCLRGKCQTFKTGRRKTKNS